MEQHKPAASTAVQPLSARWALVALLAVASPAAAQMTTGAPPPDADSAERANAPPGTIPPKHASVIVLHTSDAPDVAYRAVARLLTERGYGFQMTDATLRTITTTFRQHGNADPVQLTVLVLEDGAGAAVQFSGAFKWIAGEYLYKGASEPSRIECCGGGGSAMRRVWNELQAVAASYPGGQIEYRVPPN